MANAKLFSNGRSQAVRLPQEFRFPGREVGIAKLDNIVFLYPPGKGWEIFKQGIEGFTDDFLTTRDQPSEPRRRKKL